MTEHRPLTLRPMTLDDVDAVTELDEAAFGPSGWSRRHFVGELTESPISALYVLTDQATVGNGAAERLLGYFGVWHIVDQLHLCTFAIEPGQQGRGLGAALLQCVLRLAQRLDCVEIQLEVRVSNRAARRLYLRNGFEEQTRRRGLYSNPTEDGMLMSREMPQASPEPLPGATCWPGGVELRWNDRGGDEVERWIPANTVEAAFAAKPAID